MMTTDLEGLWSECLLSSLAIIADYYEDIGDELTTEAIHWIVANEYIPEKLREEKDWPYAAGFTSFERQGEPNICIYAQSALPEAVWVNVTGYVKDIFGEYWKYWKTKQEAYQGAIEGYKTARKKGLLL